MEYNKSKYIILLTTNFPYGGASANLLRYFTYCLKESGFEIEVLLPTGGYYGKKIDQVSKRVNEINGVKYRRLGFIHHPVNYFGKFLDNLLGLILPFFSLIKRKVKKRLDLIIIYNITSIRFLIYIFIKKLLNVKILLMLPEFYEKPQKHISLAIIKWYNFYFGIKYLSKYSDSFIVLSKYLKEYLLSQNIPEYKILLMPNLTDTNRFINVKPYKKDFITIGYIGTPTKKDGILDLIYSYSILTKKYYNLHLLIIGDITNGKSIIPKLKEYSKSLGINDSNITFNGLTSQADVPKLLLSCQILALTRPKGIFAEAGFPTKLGEYFACKKPVVLTRVGDLKEYFIDKKEVVFADPENIESIVRAFEFIINNPEKGKEIGINGYNWMLKNLYYKNQINQINIFINSIL